MALFALLPGYASKTLYCSSIAGLVGYVERKWATKGLHHHKDVVCITCPIERRLFASLLGTQGPGYTNPLVLDGVSNGLLSPNTLYASVVRGKAPSRASPLTTERITRFPEPGCAAQSQEVIDDDDHMNRCKIKHSGPPLGYSSSMQCS